MRSLLRRVDDILDRFNLPEWAAHYSFVPLWALALYGLVSPLAADVSASWASTGVCAVVGVASLIAWRQHARRLCERCAHTPLDPAAEVARHRVRLRQFHWITDTSAVFVAVIGVQALGAVVTKAPVWQTVSDVPFVVYLVAQQVLESTHRPLMPWCPQCRWGRGDGDEPFVPTAPPRVGVPA